MSKKIITDASLYLVALLLNRGVSLLLLPVYTRYLTPDEYGIIGVCTALILGLGMVFTLSMDASLTVLYYKVKEEEIKDLIVMVVISIILLPLLLTVLLSFFGESLISSQFEDVPWDPFLKISLWVALLGIPQLLPQAILRIRHQAKLNSLFNFAYFAVSTLFILYFLIYKGEGVISFFKGQVYSGIIFTVISLFLCARWTQKWSERKIRFPLWGKAYRIGLGYLPHVISIWVVNLLDRVLLNKYKIPLGDIGIYNIAYIIGMIVHVFGTGFSYVYSPLYFQKSKEPSFQAEFKRLLSGMMMVFFWITLSISVGALELLEVMTPPAYHRAAIYVPLIAIGFFFSVSIYQVSFMVIENQGKTQFSLFISLPAALLNATLNFIFIPYYGILAASVNTLLTFALMGILSVFISRKYDKLPFPWLAMILMTLLCVPVYFFSMYLTEGLPLISKIIIKGVILLITGAVMMQITGFSFSALINLVKRDKAKEIRAE